MVERLKNYIGGEWVDSDAAEVLTVKNPATGVALGDCPLGTAADLDAAVQAARRSR